MMTKYDLEPIVKTYYDALEEGDILILHWREESHGGTEGH